MALTLNYPINIAVSGSDLFVVNFGSGTISEYTTSGSLVNASLISGLQDPQGIAISGSDLFITNQNGPIAEYTTSGATVNPSLITGINGTIVSLAVSGTDLFLSNYDMGTISEYTTSGTLINASLISDSNWPYGMAVCGSNLLVEQIFNGTVGEYNMSTGAAVNSSLISGLGQQNCYYLAAVYVPEPGSISLLILGISTMLMRRRRSTRNFPYEARPTNVAGNFVQDTKVWNLVKLFSCSRPPKSRRFGQEAAHLDTSDGFSPACEQFAPVAPDIL